MLKEGCTVNDLHGGMGNAKRCFAVMCQWPLHRSARTRVQLMSASEELLSTIAPVKTTVGLDSLVRRGIATATAVVPAIINRH